jgi:hypothetical protein
MRKLLVVYNTCGIRKKLNLPRYCDSINSILRQDLEGVEVAISSCLNSDFETMSLSRTFGNRLSYNIINEKLPVNITFNHTVEKCREKLGDFEGYVYVDSGVDFENQTHALSELYDLFKSGNYSMVAARPDDDTGFDVWYGTKMSGDELFVDGHFQVPVGGATNLHVQIFSQDLVDTYPKLLPDIFAGECMESVLSFLCAAIKTKWVVHKDLILKHTNGMDGGSSGFWPKAWEANGGKRWDHLFVVTEPIRDIIERGRDFGMGYEEWQGIVMHRKDQFDDDGYCVNDDLRHYIRDNLFLNQKQFDYDNIIHTFT